MSEPWLAALRSQYQEIEGRLANAAGPDGRETLKRDIIALFKRVDGALTDLGQLKEDIRALVDRYKQAERRRGDASGPGAAVHRRPAGGACRSPGRFHLHREGLEPHLAGRLRRRDPGPGEGALACRRGRSRRNRCWAGRRCCTRTTTTRWLPSPRC